MGVSPARAAGTAAPQDNQDAFALSGAAISAAGWVGGFVMPSCLSVFVFAMWVALCLLCASVSLWFKPVGMGVKVAMILHNGMPVELLEFTES